MRAPLLRKVNTKDAISLCKGSSEGLPISLNNATTKSSSAQLHKLTTLTIEARHLWPSVLTSLRIPQCDHPLQ